jgi:hypothetical protein
MLHITNSGRSRYTFLECNCSHRGNFVRLGCNSSEIFWNTKDEAWSQHKHLHEGDKSKNTNIDGGTL